MAKMASVSRQLQRAGANLHVFGGIAAGRRLNANGPASRVLAMLLFAALVALGGCKKPRYDSSTPALAVDAMAQMVKDGRPELLPTMIDIEAREVTFSDGVTEASAISDVKKKTGDMLAQLWRVSKKLQTKYPADVAKELAKGGSWANRSGFGDVFTSVMADPFGWLDANRSRLVVDDLGDGTAAFTIDGKQVLGGTLAMRETSDGWRIAVPVTLIRGSGYFPETREEWAVLAFMMIAVENALADFENELDTGKFKNLSAASERAGRMIAESAVAQGIIFAMMKQKGDGTKPGAPSGAIELKVGKDSMQIGSTGDVQKDLGQAGDMMRKQAEP